MSRNPLPERPVGPLATPSRKKRVSSALLALTTMMTPALVNFTATPAQAATVSKIEVSGSKDNTYQASATSTLFAKQGATVKFKLTTSTDTKCVELRGIGFQHSSTAKSEWTFDTTAPAGDGEKVLTAFASPDYKLENDNTFKDCKGDTKSLEGKYVLDNTAPTLTSALNKTVSSFGWVKENVTGTWTAGDGTGSGVKSGPTPGSFTREANGIETYSSEATDQVGNKGTGSVTVRLDKADPSITPTETKNTNGTTTVKFVCADSNSGGGEASGIATCVADGTSPASDSKTVQPGETVTGTATDKAGNTKTASVTVAKGDTTAPLLSGAPQGTANDDGWYRDDVTVKWTASDPESGIPTPPADTKITAEGKGLTSTTSVKNGAGLETTATSTPAVNIDRTAPTTGISGTSNDWVNGAVNVTLSPSTNDLSGIASTTYTINGGTPQSGTSFSLANEGTHTVSYFSTDKAGNAEEAKTATIKIDKTAPTIGHKFTPLTYTDGAWTNQDVTVTFECADQGGSGLKDCTAPVTKTTEGEGQQVVGTATDNAGNSANNTATVSIDKTKPVIDAVASGTKNAAGWYQADVTVSFPASDALSGIASSSAAEVLAEGKNQSASGTATDRAGNSNGAGVSGINVDKTKPELSGSAPDGWHNGDVTVTWQASDALSGLANGVPAASTVKGEGSNLSATTSVSDVAGNDRTTTVSGIKIDRSKPTTTAEVAQAPESGWYQSGPQVTLKGSDNLSGATTFYTVNGGAKQTYSAPFTVGAEGTNTVVFWSVDGAGNIEDAPAPLTLKVDSKVPSTTVLLPPAPESGWFITSGLPVAFQAQDGANGSGIAATYYSINTIDDGAVKKYGEKFTQSLPDGENKITFWSVDIAGNVEAKETVTQTVTVNVDTTPPTISGKAINADGTERKANGHGWFNSPVDVKFTCADSGSGLQTGVAGCAGDTTLTNDGKDQTTPGNAVDVAGNKSSTVFGPVDIDQTKPTLSGTAATTGRSAAGWYKDDATVTWTGVDPLSGIDPASQPAPTTVTGEGNALVAGPVTIKDKAGNTSAEAKVEGIQIDRTAPSISGTAVNVDGTERKANADGWFNSGVRVSFTAIDALSGIQDKPSDVVLDEDGANQSAKGTTTDLANNANSATVTGINIDSKAPQTSANNKCDGDNGFCRGQTATVTLNAVDQAGLSGVKEIRYIVNGGQEKSAAGASTEVLVPLAAKSGTATVEYWAVDKAGNAETKGGVSLKYDNIAPTVTHVVDPKANANGWNNTSATVTFSAKDDDGGSGVDTASVTAPVTVSAETPATGEVVNGSAKDLAGNTGTDSATVKLDKTVPTITAAIKAGTVGANGWYTGPVTVGFTCGDTLSGIATCPADVVLNGDGKDQTASGTAVDMAGNEASAKVSGINIDSVKPAITVTGAKASYTLGEAHGITCSATDATSGVDANGCKVTVTGGTANGVGTFTYTATAKDNAGHVQTTSNTYTVLYKWEGFLQPINDTAHQVGTSTSIFKAGSTVPAKFQLKKADGTVVQANTAPAWLTPAKGSATSAAVDETAYSDPATSGSTYSWSSTDSQYRYNYGTAKTQANYYWRIGTKLDDGQIYYVNLGLR